MAIEWVEKRWSKEATLMPGLVLSVSYEGIQRLQAGEPGWNIYVFGGRLKRRAMDEAEAMNRAEGYAKGLLETALAKFSNNP